MPLSTPLAAALSFGKKLISILENSVGAPVGIYAKNHFNQFIGYIEGLPGRIVSFTSKMFNAGLNLIKGFFSGISHGSGFIANLADAITSKIKSVLNSAISQINKGINKVGGLIHIGLPNIPHLAKGAFVTSPTIALIGEKRPEVVLPTNDPARAMQLLHQSGLAASLNIGAPAVNVIVKIGDRELRQIIDTQIDVANEETSMALANGPRG